MISLKIMVSDPLSTGQESQLLLKREDTVTKLQTVMLQTIKKFKITKIQKMTLSLIMVSVLMEETGLTMLIRLTNIRVVLNSPRKIREDTVMKLLMVMLPMIKKFKTTKIQKMIS